MQLDKNEVLLDNANLTSGDHNSHTMQQLCSLNHKTTAQDSEGQNMK